MKEILAIMLGGGLGATSRHGVNIFVHRFTTGNFPVGTITVNMLGSFFIGLCGALLEHYKVAAEYRLFILTGFFGSFTTFSTFAREKAELLKVGDVKTVIVYALTSNILGVLLVFAGYMLAHHVIENWG
ncbi:MAG: fluoride efflux transporter CrcB [Proteobacteria bacterium]|nr:fluoride efflux transporter CrcB [Pseudomonadota bacterium]MBU1640005.1 fluoride efflux transporter CrcB [Pseudomonadota bacterium]